MTIESDKSVLDVMTVAAEANQDFDFVAEYQGKYSGFLVKSIGGTAATSCCYWSFNYQMPGFSDQVSSLGVSLVIPGEGWAIKMSYVYNTYKCKDGKPKDEL